MSTQPEPTKRLVRSESNRMLAGVCGGLGEFFGIDATIIRIVFVVLVFLSGAGVIAYLVMWLIVPTASKAGTPPRDVPREGFDEMRDGVERGAREAKARYERWRGEPGEEPPAASGEAPTGPPPAPPSQTAPGGPPPAPPSGATPGGPPPAPPADTPGGPPPAPPEGPGSGDEDPPPRP